LHFTQNWDEWNIFWQEKDSVQQAVSKIHDAGEAVSVKEITNYLLQEKLRRLKLGDDDLLEVCQKKVENSVLLIYLCFCRRLMVHVAKEIE